MSTESNLLVLTNEKGDKCPIESITLTETFLQPCQSFQCEAANELTPHDLAKKFAADTKVEIRLNGDLLFTGYVDECALESSRSGHKVRFSGRDMLAQIVDGYVDPRMQIGSQSTLPDIIGAVIKQFNLQLGLKESDEFRAAISKKPKPAPWSKSKHKRKNPIKDFKPRDNEGAFQYLSRICAQYGYWIWSSYDGLYMVVAGPDYDQPPTYDIVNGEGKNRILKSTATTSTRSLPSHVFVRGVDGNKGAAAPIVATIHTPVSARFRPMYLNDARAKTKEMAERLCSLQLARKLKDFFHYECTLQGLMGQTEDGAAPYMINRLARVTDDQLGVDGTMWIESRTFHQSRSGGTTTDLKLIPRNTLLLDVPQGETDLLKVSPAKTYLDAASEVQRNTGPIIAGNFRIADVRFYNR